MDKEKSQILVLVEGNKTDYNLMNKLLEIYGISDSHEVVSYHTNIYTLYQEMFQEGDPASVDLLQNFKEHEPNPHLKELFDRRYSDILLIFDLDPQDPLFSVDKITEMASYFVESSDMGKLYLNYPIVEAYYHMKSIPDPEFDSYTVSLEELTGHTYKGRVNRENRDHDYRKFGVDKKENDIVIRQNIAKAWRIAKPEALSPLSITPLEAGDILRRQLEMLSKENILSVLCTCVFYIADYNPKLLE